MATQSYKILLSNPITVENEDGINATIPNGIGMTASLGVEDISGIPGGCIAVHPVTMLDVLMYVDAITNDIVSDPLMYTGLYDPITIEQKIRKRIREIVIHMLQVDESPQTEENIQSRTLIIENTWMDKPKRSEIYVLGLILNEISYNRFDFEKSKIKYVFLNCPSDQYIFIPLRTNTYKGGVKFSHANGILVSKSKGTVYRIEPGFGSPDTEHTGIRQQKLDAGVRSVVNEIGLKDPNMNYINVVCPQTIVKDKNCIFWTQLIFRELLKNLYKKDPDTVIKELSSKPKEELDKLVYDYKLRLFQTLIPKFLKENRYRWHEFESQKDRFIREIQNEYVLTTRRSIPVQGAPPRLGGKTRRLKKSRKTRKSKNQRARQ